MLITQPRRKLRHAGFGIVARATVAGAAVALSCLMAPVASAGETVTARSGAASRVVRYGDLDLTSQADAQQLYARLQYASERVCGSRPDERDLKLQRLHDKCVSEALANAVGQVNDTKLSALHAANKRVRVAQAPG